MYPQVGSMHKSTCFAQTWRERRKHLGASRESSFTLHSNRRCLLPTLSPAHAHTKVPASVDYSLAPQQSLPRHRHPFHHQGVYVSVGSPPRMCSLHLILHHFSHRNRIRGGQDLAEVPFDTCASLAAEAIMDGQEARRMASTMWLVPRARLGREVVG